ncbi:MAG: phytanoyl-CoA dioxygenase family protein [Abditibacteriaceae bacterium]
MIDLVALAKDWTQDGFVVCRSLFSADEITQLREHFMDMHKEGLDPESSVHVHYAPKSLEECNGDVLKHFPRVMQPHRFDETSFQYLLDQQVGDVLKVLFNEEPLAAQSMFYFKPPGGRGQALHQDNFYLRVKPGTCIAAWTAVDDTDLENGSLFVVPGSQNCDVLCPHLADPSKSFTVEEVDIPAGMEPVEMRMKAGDVLFFNGSLIHGSYPNISADRFRRAFICHYMPQNTVAMSAEYYPLHDFEGNQFIRENAEGGGICGTEEMELLNVAREERDRHGALAEQKA